MIKRTLAIGLLCLAPVAVACGPKSTSAESKAKALATSTPNAQAVTTVQTDIQNCVNKVSSFDLIRSAGRKKVTECVNGLLTAPQKQALQTCAVNAAIHDHILTGPGRQRFETTDLGNCINRVVPHASTSVRVTPTK